MDGGHSLSDGFLCQNRFPKHINKTQLVAATVIFKKIPPVFHNANKCRFIVPAIQNIIFAKTIMFRKTRFFKISNCFSIFPICHIPVFPLLQILHKHNSGKNASATEDLSFVFQSVETNTGCGYRHCRPHKRSVHTRETICADLSYGNDC